jgi:hypothetical protein
LFFVPAERTADAIAASAAIAAAAAALAATAPAFSFGDFSGGGGTTTFVARDVATHPSMRRSQPSQCTYSASIISPAGVSRRRRESITVARRTPGSSRNGASTASPTVGIASTASLTIGVAI